MPENNIWLSGRSITRRAFLKGSVGAVLVVAAAGSVGAVLAACTKATADFEVTSSTDFNHSHKVKILGVDVDKPPVEKTITSDGPTHQHAITLTKADFEALKKGQQVTKVSTNTGTTPHGHTFVITVPAATEGY